MINRAELKNFGPIEQLDWQNLGKINLIIGNNDCGKSFLLKGLYSAVRTLEEYKRGDSPDFQKVDEILRYKLWWTFQPEKISYLVSNSSNTDLLFNLTFNQQKFNYSLGKTQDVISFDNQVTPRSDNSIFLPAKEILSLYHIILKTREQEKLYGFDDTYLDLAMALRLKTTEIVLAWGNGIAMGKSRSALPFNFPSTSGHNSLDFNDSRMLLEDLIGGRIELDEVSKRWYFVKDKQRFPMGVTAEGIRKIAVLDTLLGNGYLSEKSIVFIDEPESNLHPQAISQLLDIIVILAKHGIQFFLASHSYFVISPIILLLMNLLNYMNNN